MAEPPEELALLTDQEWRTIMQRLTLYAAYKLSRLWFRNGVIPGRLAGPEDVASDAIAAILSGKRSWPPHDGVAVLDALLACLKSVVDSIVNHLVESADHRLRDNEAEERPGVHQPDILDKIDCANCVRRLRECCRGDRNLFALIGLVEQGLKPGEIAQTLGVPATQVYQWIRTLKRRAMSAGLWPWPREDADA
jgi:Homeodomain-like domain-containing protein